MYLITNSANLIVEICEHPCYVRKQANGVVVLSEQDKADAIYSNDSNTFWPTQQVGYLCDRHTLVEVESVPAEVVAGFYFYHAGEFYTTEANLTALAKARAPELASLVFVKMAETEQLDDATLTEHAEQFSEWAYPVAYAVKAICSYKGKLYRCVQAHSSQADWTRRRLQVSGRKSETLRSSTPNGLSPSAHMTPMRSATRWHITASTG